MDMFCSTKKKEYFESEEFLSLSKDEQNEILREEMNKILNMTRYGLVWEEHPEQIDLKDLHLTVLKDKALSLPMIPNKPMNYLIEGDNYHALQVLQKTHKGKVDVIYIDPPYNTGKEFVYNDKLVDKEDMFSHSKWLSFMSKRLKLARELLSDDGVIFVSIDDNEQAQLKLLMDKVFGEQNSVIPFIWEKAYAPKNNNKFNSSNHEYILVYAKDKKKLNSFKRLERTEKNNSQYKYDDFDGKGKYRRSDLTAPKSKNIYPIEYQGKMYYPSKSNGWRYKKEKMKELIKQGRIHFPLNNKQRPSYKRYLKEVPGVVSKTILEHALVGHTDLAKRELDELLGSVNKFDYPKPIKLIKYFFKLYPKDNPIILDFFAGSGTTGHAVMELNKEDGGNRHFILCTNNEVSEEKEREYLAVNGYIEKPYKRLYNKFKKEQPEQYEAFLNSEDYQSLGIARSVTRERLKRVIEGYTTPKGKEVEGLPNNLVYLQTSTFTDEELIDEPEYNIERLQMIHELKYPATHYETIYVSPYENKESITNIQPKTDLPLLLVMDTEDNYLISRASEIAKKKFPQFQRIIRITDYL